MSACKGAITMSLGVACLPTMSGAAQPWFDVEIVLPADAGAGLASTQLGGGWPLVVRAMSLKDAGTYNLLADVPWTMADLAVVAWDPGGCFGTIGVDPALSCLQVPPEEVYTRFSVDVDAVGLGDVVGDASRRSALIDSAGGGAPIVNGMASDGSAATFRVGPATGGEVTDGVGYGANDDWPGLVLLANHGVGVVLDASFNPGPAATRRNLAGVLTWSTYELSDDKHRSSVSAGTTVPFKLLSPLILADDAVGQPVAPGIYSSPIRYRIDGGPVVDGPTGVRCAVNLYPSLVSGLDLELRAFLVNGTAPDVLSDSDGDGDVDAMDAELSGFKVISSESVIHYRQWGNYFGDVQVNADLDGNHTAYNAGCRPPDLGPGAIKPPPK